VIQYTLSKAKTIFGVVLSYWYITTYIDSEKEVFMSAKEATEIRVGNVLKIGSTACKVISQEVRGTGKSGKVVQLRLKNLQDGNISEKSFRAEEKAEYIDVQHATLQYLYKDGDLYMFMNNSTYEQFPLSAKVIGKQEILLKENMEVNAICVDDRPLSIEFPKSVELKVTSAPPGVKGGGDFKQIELENGLQVLAPQFVNEGESVRIDTDDFSYLERVTTKSMGSSSDAPTGRRKEE
jgi:elongation factor P